MSSTMHHPAASGRRISASSKRTRPRAPGGLSGVYGSTCFCPVSAIAHAQKPFFGPLSQPRIFGFSPFVAFSVRSSSRK